MTSVMENEEKSTVAANIAMALAMRESKVVLVDCDLRNPSVRERLNIEKEGVGLYEYLIKKAELKDILQWNETYQMYVIPGGQAGIGGYGYKNYRYYSKYGNYRAESRYKDAEKESLQS